MNTTQTTLPTYTLKQLIIYFLKLGAIGFGGPVALVGYMNRDLVEKNKWISESDYREGLALSQLAPGPLAAQLAIYIGFVHFRVLGATLVGIAFVLPSFFMVLALGWAYVEFGGIPWMQAIFYGVGASVIGIIAFSSYKLVNKSIGKDYLMWSIFLVAAFVTIITESEQVFLFLIAGIVVWIAKAPPAFLSNYFNKASLYNPLFAILLFYALPESSNDKLWKIAVFFTKAGAFVFGSGLAIVPFLYGGIVKEYGWLNEQQFIDSVAVAMITPGPVVITVAFIGFLVASVPGACVAALATFLPCYVFTILPAPYFKKYGRRPDIKAFVDGVTAAAVGAIAGAVVVLGKRTIDDIPTALIGVVTLFIIWKFKIQEPIVIVLAAAAGLILKGAVL